ncbi:MAG: DNA-deoxyinosine glycosylase, partial [Ruthenibacterium sp.]
MSFAPIAAPHARVLILGTWPSPKSREQGFYYGHPQNRFWPLLARLVGAPVPQTIAQKTALIEKNGLALWDIIASCTITGASDASLQNAVPNDIAALCQRLPIEKILCNGAAAYRFYQKYDSDTGHLQLPAVRLPSTSPANAAFRMDRL